MDTNKQQTAVDRGTIRSLKKPSKQSVQINSLQTAGTKETLYLSVLLC